MLMSSKRFMIQVFKNIYIVVQKQETVSFLGRIWINTWQQASRQNHREVHAPCAEILARAKSWTQFQNFLGICQHEGNLRAGVNESQEGREVATHRHQLWLAPPPPPPPPPPPATEAATPATPTTTTTTTTATIATATTTTIQQSQPQPNLINLIWSHLLSSHLISNHMTCLHHLISPHRKLHFQFRTFGTLSCTWPTCQESSLEGPHNISGIVLMPVQDSNKRIRYRKHKNI